MNPTDIEQYWIGYNAALAGVELAEMDNTPQVAGWLDAKANTNTKEQQAGDDMEDVEVGA
jgi:hypothetical protein